MYYFQVTYTGETEHLPSGLEALARNNDLCLPKKGERIFLTSNKYRIGPIEYSENSKVLSFLKEAKGLPGVTITRFMNTQETPIDSYHPNALFMRLFNWIEDIKS